MIRRTTSFVLGLLAFVKATVVGGVFILAPIVILAAIIGQAVNVAYHVLHPLMAWLPVQSISGVSLALLGGIAVVVLLCFFAGLLANTALATWLVKSIESAILSNLPGYSLMKNMGEGIVGLPSRDGRRAVLVHFQETSRIGFQMDQLADGRAVIFIPSVPSPWSGELHIVAPDRYEVLPVSVRNTIEILQRLGQDSGSLLSPPGDQSLPEEAQR